MKKSIFGKIRAPAVVLTLVTSSLVGGTFAKYTSSITATGSAVAAKWLVDFKVGGNKITEEAKTFTLTDTSGNTEVGSGKIAPGSSGSIAFSIDGSESEVGYSYTIKADVSELNGLPLKFHKTDKNGEVLTPDDNGIIELVTGDVELDKVATAVDSAIYWEWENTADDETANDKQYQGETGQIDVTFTATQYIKTTVQP